MAIIKRISSKAKVDKIIQYLINEEKTEENLVTAKNCNADNVVMEFEVTKEIYNKNNGVMYHHVIQSFAPGDSITPKKAHSLGVELSISEFKDYEVFIVTHKDKAHIHNHLVINSVSFVNGIKYNATNKSLWDLKRKSNEICLREGLTVLDLEKRADKRITDAEKNILDRGYMSWKEKIRTCIDLSRSKSITEEEFITVLNDEYNINTVITENNITYKDNESGNIVRGRRLGKAYEDIMPNEGGN